MLRWTTKILLATCAVAALAAAQPREADAFIFRWWRDRCCARQTARVAFFAPTACGTPQPACGSCQPACATCAPACQPACPQQVCSYQPETCYRTVFQQVPVTVFRPVTTVDPCTGCPTTTMQACTTMTTQAQRVPYTTFRQVCQMVQPQPTCCGSPAVAAQPVAPMPAPPMVQQQFVQPALPVSPGCSSCGGQQHVAPAAPIIPSVPQQFQPGPTTELAPQQPSTNLAPAPADQPPALQPSQSYYPAPTFPSNNGTAQYSTQYPTTTNYPTVTTVPSTSSGLYPVPSTTPSTGTSYQPRVPAASPPAIRPLPDVDRASPAAPALLNPQDRTAAREVPVAGTIAPIAWTTSARSLAVQPAAAPAKQWDSGGWVPAR